jgi:SAM-dependent methyltransferase
MAWLLVALGFTLFCSVVAPSFWGGAWSPTPMRVVDGMLDMAQLAGHETLYDLGAGDGRVLFRAAKTRAAQVVGVEIDPVKCWFLKAMVCAKGLSSVRIVKGDFFRVDLSGADVVFLYLSPAAHNRLREKLERELKTGARVVSYRRAMPGWRAAQVDPSRRLFLYQIGQETGCGQDGNQ